MARSIDTVRTVHDLRTRVAAWREAGETVALVPTMGAIHAGHLSLVTLANSLADRVVTSLFVNPLQFGPREDFHAYPRDEARDAAALSDAGSDLLYAPDAGEMYPPGFSTKVSVSDLTEDLCGASRPNHFDGVATVVTKLLLQCAPDKAIFGEKDYQQLLVIKRFVRDLNIPVEIVGGAIVREADGLALSSRNAYLSPAERTIAPVLHQTICQVADDLAKGRGADDASEAARFKLESEGFRVDYVAVRDPETLKPLHGPVTAARVLAAVHLGKTRLIDNVPVPAR
ncbi:pantoate--beta-alanine ligase [Methyloceanibacter superfactus]|jgi:pantoate--beta-alanine ligase|uniref:Pantothenate synthetase n=1 Tax=Methyloceanibacter superfactus TaxID=1774969 RepID=A0A1E3VSD7_9HYPH|nr:pantoate--beta-alanine ligase [Methyloceanibacter superfactus]ODR96444.1 pantoate--beta-alanine ligase [Methyloceanibacter superfactus]